MKVPPDTEIYLRMARNRPDLTLLYVNKVVDRDTATKIIEVLNQSWKKKAKAAPSR